MYIYHPSEERLEGFSHKKEDLSLCEGVMGDSCYFLF